MLVSAKRGDLYCFFIFNPNVTLFDAKGYMDGIMISICHSARTHRTLLAFFCGASDILYARAYCDSHDTCIDIINHSILIGSLTHWHLNEEEMPEELYTLGKKGNTLVLKKGLIGTGVFYMG